jgi:hypothetical protein
VALHAGAPARAREAVPVHPSDETIVCYLVVDRAGLQSLVLAFPEILLATVLFDVLLGKWRGLRLVEYVRFLGAVDRRRPEPLAPAREPRS